MRRGKGRRSNGGRRAVEECRYRMEKRGLFITQTHAHTEAQTKATINSKTGRAGRFEVRDQDAFPREALCAGRIKSRAFPARASLSQHVRAAHHKGHHYDRS